MIEGRLDALDFLTAAGVHTRSGEGGVLVDQVPFLIPLTSRLGANHPLDVTLLGSPVAISLDQFAAEHIGDQTRFRTLVLTGGGPGISWTRTGALVPAEKVPSKVFKRLFLADSPQEIETRTRQLADGRSALDDVRAQAKIIQASDIRRARLKTTLPLCPPLLRNAHTYHYRRPGRHAAAT